MTINDLPSKKDFPSFELIFTYMIAFNAQGKNLMFWPNMDSYITTKFCFEK
jgi:hypothetical protein